MKAILEFNLPEDSDEYNAARQGMDMRVALLDVDNAIRGRLKYGGIDPLETPEAALEWTRTELHRILTERGINLWE